MEKTYSAVAYLRLSREDGDGQESGSIAGQRELIAAFVKMHPELYICGEEVDDGYSGANFERPGFRRLLEQIRSGKIDCVIVKDLSRFGRNYIEAGRYIGEIFPFLGVRFIAVNDGYDSLTAAEGSAGILAPLKNLLNDAWCRDVSKKIRSQLAVKQREGAFIGSFAPFGYRKDPTDKNRLLIDPAAAEVVRKIFASKLDGMSHAAIARQLNAQNGGQEELGKLCWSAQAVGRMLKSEIYIGTVEQHKTETIDLRTRKRRRLEKAEWLRVENRHPAIVEKESFAAVQRMLELDLRVAPGQEKIYPLSGLLFCGDCGQAMVRATTRAKGREYHYYICGSYQRDRSCTRHALRETEAQQTIGRLAAIFGGRFERSHKGCVQVYEGGRWELLL